MNIGDKRPVNLKCINTFALKIIAILAMTIDHVGSVIGTDIYLGSLTLSGLIPENIYWILRSIGRLAFPIYCYLIAEGFFYTRNVFKYGARLLAFAVISQIPFSLASQKELISFKHLNVFFTLTLGLICVAVADKCIEKAKASHGNTSAISTLIAGAVFILIIMSLADALGTDYGSLGIIIILTFYFFRDKYIYQFVIIGCATNIMLPGIQMLSLFSLIPIFLHNRRKGPSLKYFFYIYYPLHLLVLYSIFARLV